MTRPVTPIRYSTAAMVPSGSDAFAVRPTVDPIGYRAPSAGVASDTLGGWLAPRTSISAALDVVASPWLSVARAEIECVPIAAFPIVKRQGGLDSVPMTVAPSRISTL